MSAAPSSSGNGNSELTPTIVAAWAFQVLFAGALAWDLLSDPVYLPAAGPLSLQLLVLLIAAPPSLLSGIWLIGLYRERIANQPVDPLLLTVDVTACVSIAVSLGAGLWIWLGGPLTYIGVLGRLPLQQLIAIVAAVPAVSGIVWLILRSYWDPQRLGLRKADHAAAKRSAQL